MERPGYLYTLYREPRTTFGAVWVNEESGDTVIISAFRPAKSVHTRENRTTEQKK